MCSDFRNNQNNNNNNEKATPRLVMTINTQRLWNVSPPLRAWLGTEVDAGSSSDV